MAGRKVYLRVKEKFLIYLKKRNKNVIISRKISNYLEGLLSVGMPLKYYASYKDIQSQKESSYQTPLTELKFLELLVKIAGAKEILEIGTFKGFTTLNLLQAAGENGRITTCELSKDNCEKAKELWKGYSVLEDIILLEGNAIESLNSLKKQNKKFDFIYVDADKKNYPKYYELAVELSLPGTIIVIDNALWAGLVAEENCSYSHARIIRELNERISNDHSNNFTFIPAWDGAMVILL